MKLSSVRSLPQTSVGKIDKLALKREYLDEKGMITEKPKVFSKVKKYCCSTFFGVL